MSSQKKIRSSIKIFLPGADESLINCLVTKVEQELNQTIRARNCRRRSPNAVVERVIKQEEISELGFK